MHGSSKEIAARQALMKACSHASASEMQAAINSVIGAPVCTDLRRPEAGLVMLRGRIGGDGAAFNFGEATMSRAAVKLQSGEIGYSYLLGRDLVRARLAAIIDAIGQRAEHRERLEAGFVASVMARVAAEADRNRRRTAATRVNFFTMVRGED
ncbi:MAG: phosphonate C-P lyase system protein PhnG [Hyphomicrobiaceae bacterium]